MVLQGMSVVQENSLSLCTLVYVGQHCTDLWCIWTHFLNSCEHPPSDNLSVILAKIVAAFMKKHGPKFQCYTLEEDV